MAIDLGELGGVGSSDVEDIVGSLTWGSVN
jgi:hypothetical protein